MSLSGAGASGDFGFAVDLNVDEVVVGSRGANSDAGLAFVYKRSGTNNDVWELKWAIAATDQQSYDELGYAVAIYGPHIVVSAPDNDDNGQSDSGT